MDINIDINIIVINIISCACYDVIRQCIEIAFEVAFG